MRILEICYEISWIIAAIVFYSISLAPGYYLVTWGQQALAFPMVLLTYPTAFFLFLLTLILTIGGVKTLLIPELKEGTHLYPDSKPVYIWFCNKGFSEILLIPFSKIIFSNDVLKYLSLRLLGAKIPYSNGISTPYITDFDLLNVGERTTIGAFTKVYPHIQVGKDKLVLGSIQVGEDSLIAGNCSVMYGTKIENRVFVGYNTKILLNTHIDNDTRIDWNCSLGKNCYIGKNVKIGSHCILGSRVTVKDNLQIPELTYIPDNAVIASEQDVCIYTYSIVYQADREEDCQIQANL